MTAETYALVLAIIVIIACFLLIFLFRHIRKLMHDAERRRVLRDILARARMQNQIFELNIHMPDKPLTDLKGTMIAQEDKTIRIMVPTSVANDFSGAPVEISFGVSEGGRQTFYKFRSVIYEMSSNDVRSIFTVTPPYDLETGQRRVFVRVKPESDNVRVIGVWLLDPNKPIPRSKNELGKPITHYKHGMKEMSVQVDNISSAGMALRFAMADTSSRPFDLDKGSQLLCLLVYATGKADTRLVTFLCTSEVVNARVEEGEEPALLLGISFTNWAVMEPGKSEINWFNTSPTLGVSPITQWVMRMNIQQQREDDQNKDA